MTTASERKINIAIALFEKHFDLDGFQQQVLSDQPHGLTPKMFIYNLQKLARQNRKKVVLPEGNDDRILRAIEILQKKDLVDMIVLGNPSEIKSRAGSLGLDIDFEKTPIIDPYSSDTFLLVPYNTLH